MLSNVLKKYQNITACFFSLLIIGGVVFLGQLYITSLIQSKINDLAPTHPKLNKTGIALQKAAFTTTNLLPIYGESEVLMEDNEMQPSVFFKAYPTGFTTYENGIPGYGSILEAQSLSGLGKVISNKKVVISFTPAQFFKERSLSKDNYNELFSKLHANEFIFSTHLSVETKKLGAKRMIDYPSTLKKETLLKYGVESLAQNTTLGLLKYYVIFPLGWANTKIIELQDEYNAYSYIRTHKLAHLNTMSKNENIDWGKIINDKKEQQAKKHFNNPYGINVKYWDSHYPDFKKKQIGSEDEVFLEALEKDKEWVDFDILLRVLKDLNAKPLLLGRPLKGQFYNATGISDKALSEYYTKLDKAAYKYSFTIRDSREFQNDIYFGVDPAPHTSREGWAYIDKILNDFYHAK
jgi:D-alanine transfer protein